MANTSNVTSSSDQSKHTAYNAPSLGSSTYRGQSDSRELRSANFSSDSPSTGASAKRSFVGARSSKKNVRLIPIKVKDAMRILETKSEYKNKTPVLVNMHGESIDRIVAQGNSAKISMSPRTSLRPSPIRVTRSSIERELARRDLERTSNEAGPSRPPLGSAAAPQVYAVHDVQAFPMVGTTGFRSDSGVRLRHASPRRRRSRSRPRFRVRKARSVRVLTKPRRGRSRRRRKTSPRRHRKYTPIRARSRPRRVVLRPRRSVIEVPRRVRRRPPLYDPCCAPQCEPQCRMYCPPPYDNCCSPYPMCESDCYPTGRPYSRGHGRSRTDFECDCVRCQEKLQFIQPGVCPKKKFAWTNEYAVIPKPQVHLIDPCDQLDRSIYPRADNPCIRDANGNPLTDCIGRPLRDPVGKRFLRFSPDGSVMNTDFRGNFYTGQPPLCVKCPMPGTSCRPDTTHNYWTSCGYPIRPDMGPFFEKVVAEEHRMRTK